MPCALGVARLPKLGIRFATCSILLTTLATLANAAPPASYFSPLSELHLPLLFKGDLSPSAGLLLRAPAWVAVAVCYAMLVGGAAWLRRRPVPNHHPKTSWRLPGPYQKSTLSVLVSPEGRAVIATDV